MNYSYFNFPAAKGIQAQQEYYASMVPLAIAAKLFNLDNETINDERLLNENKIPEIRDYIIDNPDSYVFSSISVAVNEEIKFCASNEEMPLIGTLEIPMTADFLINDGVHRIAAIQKAIHINPDLKKECIPVNFYFDKDFLRSKQMHSDLSKKAATPYKMVKSNISEFSIENIINGVEIFKDLTEMNKTSLASRSRCLFTSNTLLTATDKLLENIDLSIDDKENLAIKYWNTVASHMKEWNDVKNGIRKSSDIRKDYVCLLSITIVALGYAGNALIKAYPEEWEERLSKLDSINWKKDNLDWEEIIFVNGKVTANRSTQRVMSSYMRTLLCYK